MTYTLITGASGGIGYALARQLAAKKHDLILVARNAEKLAQLSHQLQADYGVQVVFIAADLAQPEAAQHLYHETQQHHWQVDLLVNNAGIGSGGEFMSLALPSELALLQLNTASLVALTHLFLHPMRERRSGTIINIASMTAFMPVPYMATYAASKVFVRSFTEALAQECKPYGIDILLFAPGLTRTNFNEAAGLTPDKAAGLNSDYKPGTSQTPEEVAEELVHALQAKKPFHISGRRNRLGARLLALLPNSFIARYMARSYQQQLTPQ